MMKVALDNSELIEKEVYRLINEVKKRKEEEYEKRLREIVEEAKREGENIYRQIIKEYEREAKIMYSSKILKEKLKIRDLILKLKRDLYEDLRKELGNVNEVLLSRLVNKYFEEFVLSKVKG